MIKSLYIKDFALIDELEVSFEEGLNILTGQTGAGKSIIVGAGGGGGALVKPLPKPL